LEVEDAHRDENDCCCGTIMSEMLKRFLDVEPANDFVSSAVQEFAVHELLGL